MRFLVGGFLVAHALIHLAYLTPAPPRAADGPEWPFETARSWLVTGVGMDPAVVRALGAALAILTVASFVGAALATVGWLVPSSWWVPLVAAGAAASLLTLLIFFHPWLVVGIGIDVALLWWAFVAGGPSEAWFGG